MYSLLVRSAFAKGGVNIYDIYAPAKAFPSIGDLLNVIIRNIFTVAGVVVLIVIVISGLQMIVSAGSGEAEKTGKAKNAFTGAVIGLIIIFGAYFLIQIIETLIGYKILNPDLPGLR